MIFELFWQSDSSLTRSHEGLGLGLYLAKHFTELLGGTIQVESDVNKGSSFTVIIPTTVSSSVASDQAGFGAFNKGYTIEVSPSSPKFQHEDLKER